MQIPNLASYGGLVTYALPPAGLALEWLGRHLGPVVANGGKGASNENANENAANDLVIKGKTIQQVATLLLLIKTGLDYGLREDYLIASAAGVGTAAIVAGGIFDSRLEGWVGYGDRCKQFSVSVDYGVLAINLINVLVINGANHFKIGSLIEQGIVGFSMAATTVGMIGVLSKQPKD